MANKYLNTRILLKYDTLANWEKNDPTLEKGEIAVVAVPSGDSQGTVSGTTPPQILFKVGDDKKSKFSALQWTSGMAADVYAWAKTAKPGDSITLGTEGAGNAITSLKWVGNKIVGVLGQKFALSSEMPTGFNITANKTDDGVVNVTSSGGKNSVTYNITHAKKGPSTGYTSENTTTSIGAGESKVIKLPQITVDAYGHTTAAKDEEISITIPKMPTIPSGTGSVIPSDDVSVVDQVSLSGHTLTGSTKKFVGTRGIGITGTADQITVTGPDLSSYAKTEDVNNKLDTKLGKTETAADSNKLGTKTKAEVIAEAREGYATEAYVDSAVAGAVQYYGVVNSTADLGKDMTSSASAKPAAKIGKGDFYRVGTAFSDLKVGDLLIAKAGQTAYTAVSNYDRVAQENYKGTVTSVSGTDGLTGNVTSSGSLSHAVPSGATAGARGSADNRTYIKTVTTDKFGHVTGVTTGTETVENTNTAHSHAVGSGLSMSGSGGTSGTVTYSLKQSTTTEIGGGKAIPSGGAMPGGKNYEVQIDNTGKYFVSVPWENTTYTVNNGTFTVTGKNGIKGSGSMSANQSGNTTADLEIDFDVVARKSDIKPGTITGVTAGKGLTGGGSSGTVTLNVGAGTGITANADTVEVNDYNNILSAKNASTSLASAGNLVDEAGDTIFFCCGDSNC